MLSAKDFVNKLEKLIKSNYSADNKIDMFKVLIKKYPEVKKYNVNGFSLLYNNGLMPLNAKDTQNEVRGRIKCDKDPEINKGLPKKQVKSDLISDKDELKQINEAIKQGHKYLQDVSVITADGFPLDSGYTNNFLAKWLGNILNGVNLYLIRYTNIVNTKQAHALINHVIGGLYDLRSEAYRETHNTIPADTKDYHKIANKINYSISNYVQEDKLLLKYRPTKVDKRVIVPFGYIDSCGGDYHRFGKKELRKAVNEMKKHAPCLQTSLF